jgi:stage V sporulation protein D (sporulation-specific penicillin-binding protein)
MVDSQRRLLIIFLIFSGLFVIIILRLLNLQVLHGREIKERSRDQRTRIIQLAARRGDIFDCNGKLLATSLDTYSVYQLRQGWLARKLSLAEAQKLVAVNPKQFSLLKEKKRVYPHDNLASQIIGFVGSDNQGLSGVELSFDEYLRGKEGRVITEGDPTGRELYGAARELEPGNDGWDLTLTIDENIQYIAEREISRQMKTSKARQGICLVMDLNNGDILALASKPDFDPNKYAQSPVSSWHPYFIDPYEPGSTFKTITVAAGLASGVINPDSKLQAQDKLEIGGKVIENSHKILWPGKQYSLSFMLEQSINTGAAQIGIKMGPERFYQQLTNLGLGESTRIGLRGESRGILRHWRDWHKPDIAMITFGQSIAVTPLQLISAISPFATGGEQVEPVLIKEIKSADGQFIKSFSPPKKKVLSQDVADELKKMMHNVVLYGSGKRSSIEAFGVAGKTGTAQKVGGGGYLKNRFISSYVGFAPLNKPRIIALVIIDEPQDTIWGERVAAPVWREVVYYTLRYLNVKPDMI